MITIDSHAPSRNPKKTQLLCSLWIRLAPNNDWSGGAIYRGCSAIRGMSVTECVLDHNQGPWRSDVATPDQLSPAWRSIERGAGVWQSFSPHGSFNRSKRKKGVEMRLRLTLGIVAVAIAATSVDMPVWADDTGLASIHALRRERARICMSDHWHYGNSSALRSERAARREAIRSWQNFVALEYGSDWGRYYRSGSRKMVCRRSDSGWGCDAEGRPCRSR